MHTFLAPDASDIHAHELTMPTVNAIICALPSESFNQGGGRVSHSLLDRRWGAIATVLLVLTAARWSSVADTALAHTYSFHSFQTPSGNIGCLVYGGYLRCDIAHKSWQGPHRPQSCRLDYGDSFVMSKSGRPQWGCHGDTVLDPKLRVLPYGAKWHSGAFRCTSRLTGITCTNRRHHGFFLSRQSYRRF